MTEKPESLASPLASSPKGFLEETELVDINKLAQECRTVARQASEGLRSFFLEGPSMPALGPDGRNIKEAMLKKEGSTQASGSDLAMALQGVMVWGGRVSPLFPPYLEAGLILLDQLSPWTRNRCWIYWKACSGGVLELASLIHPELSKGISLPVRFP